MLIIDPKLAFLAFTAGLSKFTAAFWLSEKSA